MYIDDYFKKQKDFITNSGIIIYENIITEMRSVFAGKIKGKLIFKDDSKLYFTEIVDVEEEIKKFRYAYEYIKDNEEIFRYDNAPHHRELINFPHHKHIGAKVEDSLEPNMEKILREINLLIIKKPL